MSGPLEPLRALLDERVVGHDEAKQALLLALLCREHVYLEGPPGSAKTLMAELAARGSGLSFFFYQLHRDTRLAELVGDVVLERSALPDGSGERVRQAIEPGGILTAEVCLLDDISRAPGEALNVLLRVLNERKLGERSIPLLTAIATGNPLRDEYYNEPLDPANLDRFALQLRVPGLLASGDDRAARTLIDRFAEDGREPAADPEPVVSRAELDRLHAELLEIPVPDPIKHALIGFLKILVNEHDCSDRDSLLSDRTFLVKVLKLLRGHARLCGRDRVEPADLDVLSSMTTFRVPEEVHEKVPDVLARVRP